MNIHEKNRWRWAQKKIQFLCDSGKNPKKYSELRKSPLLTFFFRISRFAETLAVEKFAICDDMWRGKIRKMNFPHLSVHCKVARRFCTRKIDSRCWWIERQFKLTIKLQLHMTFLVLAWVDEIIRSAQNCDDQLLRFECGIKKSLVYIFLRSHTQFLRKIMSSFTPLTALNKSQYRSNHFNFLYIPKRLWVECRRRECFAAQISTKGGFQKWRDKKSTTSEKESFWIHN